MSGKLAVYGVLFLVSSTIAGVVDINNNRPDPSNNRDDKNKEPEKKPNIVKDYICMRDGELCHPNHAGNRGLYVSCSNAVAWEQQCPKCAYHPLNCPTRTLWFDGEKCEWASPKLASQPCIDRFPVFEAHNLTEKDAPLPSPYGISEQESLLQSLQAPQIPVSIPNSMKEQLQQADKGKWSGNSNSNSISSASPPMYFKSPKSGDFDSESIQEIDEKSAPEDSALMIDDEDEDMTVAALKNKNLRRKSAEAGEPDFPNYLSADDGALGSKIVRLSEPVYALVNSPDGSGKQVLMRVFQPFVFEDSARTLLPNYVNRWAE